MKGDETKRSKEERKGEERKRVGGGRVRAESAAAARVEAEFQKSSKTPEAVSCCYAATIDHLAVVGRGGHAVRLSGRESSPRGVQCVRVLRAAPSRAEPSRAEPSRVDQLARIVVAARQLAVSCTRHVACVTRSTCVLLLLAVLRNLSRAVLVRLPNRTSDRDVLDSDSLLFSSPHQTRAARVLPLRGFLSITDHRVTYSVAAVRSKFEFEFGHGTNILLSKKKRKKREIPSCQRAVNYEIERGLVQSKLFESPFEQHGLNNTYRGCVRCRRCGIVT